MAALPVLDDDDLQKIYVWVDSIALSRPKRNISRDFSDGVLVAEVMHHYFPKLVEMHNYSNANSLRQKLYNWGTLNQKVFKRLGYEVKRGDVEAIVNCKPGVIEAVLMQLQQKMAEYRAGKRPAFDASDNNNGSYSPRSSDGGMDAPTSGRQHAGGDGRAAAAAAAIAGAAPSRGSSSSGGGVGDSALGHRAAAAPPSTSSASSSSGAAAAASAAALAERDGLIGELRETVDILELKIRKLEQLVRLKDTRIATLTARLASAGLGAATSGTGLPAHQ